MLPSTGTEQAPTGRRHPYDTRIASRTVVWSSGPSWGITQRQPLSPGYAGSDPGGRHWVVERTNSWLNGCGKQCPLHRPRRAHCRLFLYPGRRVTTARCLIQRARTGYRWDNRSLPTAARDLLPDAFRSAKGSGARAG